MIGGEEESGLPDAKSAPVPFADSPSTSCLLFVHFSFTLCLPGSGTVEGNLHHVRPLAVLLSSMPDASMNSLRGSATRRKGEENHDVEVN